MSKAAELLKLMTQSGSTEVECGTYLKEMAHCLIPFHAVPGDIVKTGVEERSRPGNCDFVVTAEFDTGGVLSRRVAYIWELKAPQKYLFEQERSDIRLRPTAELYSAENQLLNYVEDLKSNVQFKTKYKVDAPIDAVIPGGIIIGRDDTFVDVPKREDPETFKDLARLAYSIRESYFWLPSGIKVYTWSWAHKQLLKLEEQANKMGSLTPVPSSTPPASVMSFSTTNNFLTFAAQCFAEKTQASWRSAVSSAFSAVEMKVASKISVEKRKGPISPFLYAFGKKEMDVKFRILRDARNRSVHVFNVDLTEKEVSIALGFARDICEYLSQDDATVEIRENL